MSEHNEPIILRFVILAYPRRGE